MKKFLSILLAVLVIGACATTDASAKKRVTKGKKATKTAVTTLNKDFLDGTWISINDIRGSVYTFSYDPVKKTISGTCSAHGGDEWNVSGVVRGKTIAQILDIQEQYYVGLDIDGNDFTSSRFLSDDKIHLWTIQDAKDGDLIYVSTEVKGIQAIFREYKDKTIFFHCYLCRDFAQDGYMPIGNVELVYPLQKTHYERFFEKIPAGSSFLRSDRQRSTISTGQPLAAAISLVS